MKVPPMNLHILQLSVLALLSFTLLLSSAPIAALLRLLSANLRLTLMCATLALLPILLHYFTRPNPIFLLNYSCYKPPPHRKCSFPVAESFVRRNPRVGPHAVDFMRKIYLKSGLGDDTYAPPFIFDKKDDVPTFKYAVQEAEEGLFTCVDALLSKTLMDPLDIDIVVVTCGSFSPEPSLSSLIVNRYKLKPDVKTYNLSGMGCGSGVIALDCAARILQGSRKVRNALVVITESITLNWYNGDNRSMLVSNCIFRIGCAASILTNDPKRRRFSKMQLVHSLRTHHGAQDTSYKAAFQEEDEKGNTGISLTKDLVRVAGVNLTQHIKILGPKVLPFSQIVQYVYHVAVNAIMVSFSSDEKKLIKLPPIVPDFTKAFDHLCIHTGGKAVIENVGRVLKLAEELTEPARMTLHRFGNTSSSLVLYELAYFEAKKRTKKGDKIWMLGFGTGFKIGSLVWKWVQDSGQDLDNPWNDCIDNYPVKAY